MPAVRRYEITDFEWSIIEPLLPNKPRGVPRADDRKVLNGIYWRLRSGSTWDEIPERYGPYTTCYNRFVRWGNPLIRTTFCPALLYRRSRKSAYSAGSRWRIKTFRLPGAQKRTRTSTPCGAAT